MKIESYVLLFMAAFGAVICAVYWFTSYEDAGSIMLGAFGLLGLLPGGYYYWWSRRMSPRPEDDPEATQAQGAGVVGAFPGTSIWPFTLGMGSFFTVLALVFGIWLLVPGLALVIWALFGGVAESRRGGKV